MAKFSSIKDLQRFAFLEKAYTEGVYADTPANRKLGRVGMSYAAYAKIKGESKENEKKDISKQEYDLLKKEYKILHNASLSYKLTPKDAKRHDYLLKIINDYKEKSINLKNHNENKKEFYYDFEKLDPLVKDFFKENFGNKANDVYNYIQTEYSHYKNNEKNIYNDYLKKVNNFYDKYYKENKDILNEYIEYIKEKDDINKEKYINDYNKIKNIDSRQFKAFKKSKLLPLKFNYEEEIKGRGGYKTPSHVRIEINNDLSNLIDFNTLVNHLGFMYTSDNLSKDKKFSKELIKKLENFDEEKKNLDFSLQKNFSKKIEKYIENNFGKDKISKIQIYSK